jgi:endonuclease III
MTETEDRLLEVSKKLLERYQRHAPAQKQSDEDPIEGLIETILSQQNIGMVTHRMYLALKDVFPTWDDALEAGQSSIQTVLENAGGGLASVKAKYIFRVLEKLQTDRGSLSLEFLRKFAAAKARAVLESLPGVGAKTASCVLMFDLGLAAMPVDTHLHRIAKRLEFVSPDSSAVQTESWFDTHLPRTWAKRYEFHVNGFQHGRETCRSQKPKCVECVLFELCPSGLMFD